MTFFSSRMTLSGLHTGKHSCCMHKLPVSRGGTRDAEAVSWTDVLNVKAAWRLGAVGPIIGTHTEALDPLWHHTERT